MWVYVCSVPVVHRTVQAVFSKHYTHCNEALQEREAKAMGGRPPRVYCKRRKAGQGLGTRLYTSHCAHGRQVVAHILHIAELFGGSGCHTIVGKSFEVQRLDFKRRKTITSALRHAGLTKACIRLTLLSSLSPKIGFQAEKDNY